MATAANKATKSGFPRFLFLWILVPFVLGYIVSRIHLDAVESFLKPHLDRLFPKNTSFSNDHRILNSDAADENALTALITDCIEKKLPKALFPRDSQDVSMFANVTFGIHRNGESESCGRTEKGFYEALKVAVETHVRDFKQCPSFDKYSTESLLTRAFRNMLGSSCPSPETDRSDDLALFGFCDMGETRTPILQDHMRLVPIAVKESNDEAFLPCHFHTVSRTGIVMAIHVGDSPLLQSTGPRCESDFFTSARRTCETIIVFRRRNRSS